MFFTIILKILQEMYRVYIPNFLPLSAARRDWSSGQSTDEVLYNIRRFDLHDAQRKETRGWWPEVSESGGVLTVLLTSGASCPDSAVDRVLQKILERAGGGRDVDDVLQQFEQEQSNLGSV